MHNARDLGSHIESKYANGGRLVAAGTGDNTKVNGATINRMAAGGAGYLSAVLAIAVHAVLTATKDCTIAVEVQESADGSSWDTAVVLRAAASPFTAAQVAAGGDQTAIIEIAENLAPRKQYVRYNVTPDLSHSGTDTAEHAAVLVLGGADASPV